MAQRKVKFVMEDQFPNPNILRVVDFARNKLAQDAKEIKYTKNFQVEMLSEKITSQSARPAALIFTREWEATELESK